VSTESVLDRSEPRFQADAMLGGLARWLRALGVDVAFDARLDDAELVRAAQAEERWILTRDRKLVERRAARRHLLVESERLHDQVRQVLARFAIEPRSERVLTRCLRCNTPLAELDAAAAAPHVPPFVLRTQDRFRRCPTCGRIYWRATHVERMKQRLRAFGVALE